MLGFRHQNKMEVFGWDISLWWALALVTLYAAYKYGTSTFSKFENTPGIKGPRPIPFMGNMMAIMGKGTVEFDNEMIGKYGKVIPYWFGRFPILLVSDVNIIKQILVKEFPSFCDRIKDLKIGYPGDQMVSMMKGEEWKRVRSLVSRTMTSGKLRVMPETMKKSCDALLKNLSSQGNEAVDVRKYAGSFTMDVIASTAFGLDIESQADPENTFVKMASVIMDAKIWNPRVMLMIFLPAVNNFLCKRGYSTMANAPIKFFTSIVEKAMEERSKGGDEWKDFLQLMMNAHEIKETEEEDDDSGPKKGLTKQEVLAQCILFFLAGYDTIKSALTFLMFALATNPEIQEKVRQEMKDKIGKGAVSYDSISKLTYLEMVMNETMRMYPPTFRTDRVCVEDITINGVFFPEGVAVSIPNHYLHNDPTVWPEPETFKPERFTEEAKAERNPYYYLPFGLGPRHCVAMRLALLEIKVAMATILPKLKIVTTQDTKIPIERNKFTGKPEECKLAFEKI